MVIFKQHIILFSTLLLLTSNLYSANDILVTTIEELNVAVKSVKAGDRIILKNGEWKDVQLSLKGQGTVDQPITIEAEESGKVIITGDSNISISGKHLIIRGFWFKEGFTSSKAVVSFRTSSKEFATNSRVTECAITYFNPSDKSQKYQWIDLWGTNNRVDHNYFIGKNNKGPVLVVWLKGEMHIKNNHIIDQNYFAGRPPLGENGGETIRIGTSKNSMSSSNTIVENNKFEKCNGEVEIISNKSCDNIYRNNLFIENEGVLTLRHGNRALVEGNVFLGNQKPNTGGIRVINEGHQVRNNLMIGLTGSGFRGPIVVMNGVPNSPLNRYHQVKNVDIQNNTLINCSPIQLGAGSDDERSLPPIASIFANNLIYNAIGGEIFKIHDDISDIQFTKNFVDAKNYAALKGFEKHSIIWKEGSKIPIPTSSNETLKISKLNSNSPEVDITGEKRTSFFAGAFNADNTKLPLALTNNFGPISWKPIIEKPQVAKIKMVLDVKPGIETLRNAIKKASSGTTLNLESGEYFFEKSIKIDKHITIKGASGKSKPILKFTEELLKTPNYFFKVNEGSSLRLKNIEITGSNKTPIKYAVISPDENAPKSYAVFIDNCHIHSFKNEAGGAIFKAYKGTFADTLSIKNSRIENSYRGLNLSYEKDDKGKYNAQVVILENSIFTEIKEWAINYYRGGSDESTLGGQLYVNNCVFSSVGNKEKGSVLKTEGIVFVDIKNSVFEKSFKLEYPMNLKGPKNTINNCIIFDCGTLKISKGATDKNVSYKNPKWEDKNNFIPSEKSPLLKNPDKQIGLRL